MKYFWDPLGFLNLSSRARTHSVALAVAAALSGCSPPPPTSHLVAATSTAAALPSAVVSQRSETLPPLSSTPDTYAPYRLGPDDVISISVYMHPELSQPEPGQTSGSGGVMITSGGTVGLPLVGTVKLSGLTLAQAQSLLTSAYGQYIQSPNVAVQLVSARSLRYYLLGDFSSPGVKYPGHDLTLLEALALGGNLNVDNADLYQAYVAVGSRKLPVDLRALLVNGDMTQNIVLQPSATIVVPPSSYEKAFVFGAVGKPGAIAFQGGGLTLLQAMSEAGMDLSNYTQAQMAQVRLIRSHGASADFIVVDASKILDGQAVPFPLQPGDIVFVPPTGVATWNQVLDKLLPSLNTVAGILNPFVSIKYLSN